MDYITYAPALGLAVVLGILLFLRYQPKGVLRPVTTKGPIVFEKVTLCLTEADQLFFIRQRRKLADLGFVDVGDFTLTGRTPKGIYRAMIHQSEPVYAVLSQIQAKKPQQYLTYHTLLSEGIPLATDNQEAPDRGGHPRLQRLPGASPKETLEYHTKYLKELQEDGIKVRATLRESFYKDYAEILIVSALSNKGTLRQGDVAKELAKLPALDVAKMLKPLCQPEKAVEPEQPQPVPEKKALSSELKLLKERKEKLENPTDPMTKVIASTQVKEAPIPPEPAVASEPVSVPVPPFAVSVEEETLIKFEDIPMDAAALLPFAINEIQPEAKVEVKPEIKPEPIQEIPTQDPKVDSAPKTEVPKLEAKPEDKAESKDEKKPSRLKAPEKCPACGEPVLSPLSSYCRKCKAYLRG